MGMYEKIPKKVEAYAWLGPDVKNQFPPRFTPEISRTPYGGRGYVLVDYEDEFQTLEVGDYILKIFEDGYTRVRKANFEGQYRAVVNS